MNPLKSELVKFINKTNIILHPVTLGKPKDIPVTVNRPDTLA